VLVKVSARHRVQARGPRTAQAGSGRGPRLEQGATQPSPSVVLSASHAASQAAPLARARPGHASSLPAALVPNCTSPPSPNLRPAGPAPSPTCTCGSRTRWTPGLSARHATPGPRCWWWAPGPPGSAHAAAMQHRRGQQRACAGARPAGARGDWESVCGGSACVLTAQEDAWVGTPDGQADACMTECGRRARNNARPECSALVQHPVNKARPRLPAPTFFAGPSLTADGPAAWPSCVPASPSAITLPPSDLRTTTCACADTSPLPLELAVGEAAS